MNEKYKITQLLFALKKIYNSNDWSVHNLGEGYIYLYYKKTQILHVRKLSSTGTINAIVKFIILCIIDEPSKFGIKKIICKLKKK